MKDLSLHILDIIQNSIKANALMIELSLYIEEDNLILKIKDNGDGIKQEILTTVFDPFTTTRTTRKVGLGLPLLKSNVEFAGGSVSISSFEKEGTEVVAILPVQNVDRKPLGMLAETITLTILSYPTIRIILSLKNKEQSFYFDTQEIQNRLESVEINNNDVISWINEYINENIRKIFGGVLYEITC